MKKLALLDVDGTLTDTVAVDLRCFLATLSALFGFSAQAGDYDWEAIPHATDPGLLHGAFTQFAGRPPNAEESEVFVSRFVARLESTAREQPAAFRAIGGAGALVAALAASPEWDFAVATGCWAESARLKLELADLEAAGEPLASASDAVSREKVFALALARAVGHGTRPAVVLVGDGTWDAVTARNLGLPFVGVARAERATSLERLGAAAVLPDFRDLAGALAALSSAAGGGE